MSNDGTVKQNHHMVGVMAMQAFISTKHDKMQATPGIILICTTENERNSCREHLETVQCL